MKRGRSQPSISNSSFFSQWKPGTTLLGGGHQSPGGDEDVKVAARGDRRCQSCAGGGSWGTTGMYEMEGRILCPECAVKAAGAQDLPADEKVRILEPYLLKPK
jgi:hypothetical protein